MIQPGSKLAHYEIVSALGKGGMGEVWRARDSKLGREVAIKTLPEEFAKDEERLARFEREAKLLASLNHPNIAAIYGLEEDNGTRFLVLELVEGDTLADRLKRGAIPVEESLKLALQIAEALEAAHEKGVIHRDLKPANIKVTPAGKIKVLDFGLAKAFAGDGSAVNLSQSPTLSMAATQQGVILGTAAYMSPEQASGDSTDKRADIWSFGVVLFEMVTGRKTFDGKTVAHILADVLRAEPEWNSLPPNLHPRLRLLLERCLEKEAKDRCHDIADVRVDIQKVLADPGGVIAQPGNGVRPRRVMPGMFALFSAFVLGGVLVGLSLWSFTTTPPVPTVKRFSITAEGEPQRTMALSADGRYLVYQTKGQLYLRAMHQMESAPIPGTEGGQDPMLSPDGQELAFVTDTQVKKVSLTDGSLDILTDFDLGNLGQWGPQGQIIFGTEGPGGLFKVSENGGLPEPLVELDGYLDVDWPVVLPGGEWVLFSADDGTRPDGQRAFHVVAESLVSGDRRVLLDDGRFARYAPTGHLIFFRDGRLFAVGFDADQVQTTGTPVQMIENVAGGTGFSNVPFALADDGSLVYVPGTGPSDSRILALAHRNGGVEPLDVPPAQYFSPRISPDGTRLAVQTLEDDGRNQVWVYDLAGDTQIRRLTQDGSNERPVWTPDSKRVTFSSDREGTLGIYSQPADFSGAAEKLVTVEGASLLWPESYSPDGTLSFTQQQGSYRSIWTLSPDAGATPELFYDAPGSAQAGTAFSPDGDWLAYYSQESGPSQIFVKSLSQAGLPRIQVTQENSVLPMWSRDGTEMFYRRSFASPAFAGNTGATLISVEIATDRGFSFRNERVLPISGFLVFSTYRDYDVMPDGERFVVIVPADATETTEAARPQINVILNFFEELKDRVPVP